MVSRIDGLKVCTLKVVEDQDTQSDHEEVSYEGPTDQLRVFTAQVTALLADVEVALEATIARELYGLGTVGDDGESTGRRLRPRNFSKAA